MKMLKIASTFLAAFVACSAFAQTTGDFSITTTNNGGPGSISSTSDTIISEGLVTISGDISVMGGYESGTGSAADVIDIQVTWFDTSDSSYHTTGNLVNNSGPSTGTGNNSLSYLTFAGTPLTAQGSTSISYTFAVPNTATQVQVVATGSVSSYAYEAISMLNGTITTSAIPEPSTYAAIIGVLALGGLGVRRMRRRKQVQG